MVNQRSLIDKESVRGFFGRRTGRPLNKTRKDLLENLLPRLKLEIGETISFPKKVNSLWMEIGFGDGEHLAALLRKYPDVGFVGVEPYINGMGNFLSRIKDDPHDNVRIYMDDAIPLVERMPEASIERLYVLNPDPWPKTRHHKRRIINQRNLDLFARILKPGGLLIMATDVDDLAEWMVTECSKHPAFTWTAESAKDWQNPPDWWELTTRYAQKGIQAGRNQTYLVFAKAA